MGERIITRERGVNILWAAEEKQRMAEERLEVVESEMCVLKTRLDSASIEIDAAKEVARQSGARIIDLEAAVTEAKREAVESERKALEAEKRAAEAVEDFRKSKAFDKELAKSAAFAYDAGFQDCKEKIQELYDIEDIEGLKPDDVPEDDDPAPNDP